MVSLGFELQQYEASSTYKSDTFTQIPSFRSYLTHIDTIAKLLEVSGMRYAVQAGLTEVGSFQWVIEWVLTRIEDILDS